MRLFDHLPRRPSRSPGGPRWVRPGLERLESRNLFDASGVLAGGILTITGSPVPFDRIYLSLSPTAGGQLVLQDNGQLVGTFPNAAVTSIVINAAGATNMIRIAPEVTQPATVRGGPVVNYLYAGGGPTTLTAGPGTNRLEGGAGSNLLDGTNGLDNSFFGTGGTDVMLAGGGRNFFFGAKDRDTVPTSDPAGNFDFRINNSPANLTDFLGLTPSPVQTLSVDEVRVLLDRAAAASASDDGIVAVVDRGGRILGVRVEGNVSPAITGNTHNLVFAIDGAVALARTGAFFGNAQAPLTSRTIQFISQSTITQREVESDPSITDPNSTLRGPGFVAPIGVGGHFPPNIPFTPQVDLFQIEHTNRDTTFHPGPSGIAGGPDSVYLPERFNIDPAFYSPRIPLNQHLAAPDSYGFESGLEPNAQPRGIGTLPGGIPIIKNGVVVGGIGVFFPGQTGFADAENSSLSSNHDPSKPDRSLEAEYDAFAALGGTAGFQVGTLGGVAPLPEISLPLGRIDLVGITLPLFGPGGAFEGPEFLFRYGQTLGVGNPASGFNAPLLQPNPRDNRVIQENAAGQPILGPGGLPLLVTQRAPGNLLPGTPVPEGWIVEPHNGAGITAAQVAQMVAQGVEQALQTRAAIRLPAGSPTAMIFAVTDNTGAVLGLFRMPDATVFSLDVAVAKARNVAYYANPLQLQPIDQAPGVQAGVAFTNRTFRYLSEPFFPEGINGQPPGPFSQLNVGNVSLATATELGPPLPASAFYNNVVGHDAFYPQTNFHDPYNILNQNGIVFFPGSVPVYANSLLIGGLGVSGDGVDQDDVVTFFAKQGFDTPPNVLRADEVFVRGIRLPYQKFNRQPEIP